MAAERDLPPGHPSSVDYKPGSADAAAWLEHQRSLESSRDWPPGHAGAADNPSRVEPTHPRDTARDFSRPHTVGADELKPAAAGPKE